MAYRGDSDSDSELSPGRGGESGAYLDAEDLGLAPESEACREVVEDIGSSPPWSLAAIRGLFDRRYPGWDGSPTLAMSSPVRRLRSLCDAVGGGEGDDAAEEALQALSHEVKYAQIKVMCPRAEGGGLTDECQFLLLALEQTGLALRRERDARRRDNRRATQRLEDMDAVRRGAQDDATLVAREEARERIEELAGEAEAQRAAADALRSEVEELRSREDATRELMLRLEGAERELAKLARERDEALQELRESNRRCSSLAAENASHEGAIDMLSRQLAQGSSKPAAAALVERARAAAAGGHARLYAFAAGVRASALVADRAATARAVLVAWRLMRLQASWARAGEAASADSLEAELALTGNRPPKEASFSGTCGYCGRYNEPEEGEGEPAAAGARELWLETCAGAFARRPSQRRLAPARPRRSLKRAVSHALCGTVLAGVAALAAEPHLSGGW